MPKIWIVLFLLIAHLGSAQSSFEVQELYADSLVGEEIYEEANKIYSELRIAYETATRYDKVAETTIKIAKIEEDSLFVIELLEQTILQVEGRVEDTVMADIHHYLGIVYYDKLDENFKAIDEWEQALSYRDGTLPEHHIKFLKANRNIGNAYYDEGFFEKATDFLQTSLDSYNEGGHSDTIRLIKTYTELGLSLAELGEFETAEDYLTQAFHLSEAAFLQEEPWALGEIYENMYIFYKKQGDFSKMLKYPKASLKIYKGLADVYEEDYERMANCYNNLGLTYEMMDSLDEAAAAFDTSIELNNKFKLSNSLAENYTNYALVYKKKKAYEQALAYIDKAFDADKVSGSAISMDAHFSNRADIFVEQGKFDEAMVFYQNSLERLVPSFSPKDIYDLPSTDAFIIDSKSNLATRLNDKAKAFFLKYKSDKDTKALCAATETYDSMSVLLNKMRLNLEVDGSKLFLGKKAHELLENAIEANVTQYERSGEKQSLAKIFQLMEQSKAMIVLDAQVEKKAVLYVPSDVLEKERTLQDEINRLEKEIQLENKEDSRQEVILKRRTLERLQAQIKQNYPKYAALKYASQNLGIEDIQLEESQTLINYFVGESMIYALLVGPSGKDLVRIPLDFSLKSLVDDFCESARKWNPKKVKTESYKKRYEAAAYQLYQKLVFKISKAYPLTEKLLIIPDGVLGYLPFDGLLMEQPKAGETAKDYAYLLKKHEISYVYSLTLLNEMKKQSINSSRSLIFALDFDDSKKHDPIIYSILEGQSVQALTDGVLFENADATKKQFQNISPNYSIIHFSSHAAASDSLGDYSYLVFAENADSLNSEFLYLTDIYGLSLQANMVYLSACETGIGELKKGEGILSLARGFTYAGAKSIITTLWSVDGESTQDITEGFYHYLKEEGASKSAALRQAKLDYINNNQNLAQPYYWAAAIPVGDMTAIDFSSGFPYWSILLVGLILVLFWGGLKRLL